MAATSICLCLLGLPSLSCPVGQSTQVFIAIAIIIIVIIIVIRVDSSALWGLAVPMVISIGLWVATVGHVLRRGHKVGQQQQQQQYKSRQRIWAE